MNQTIQSLRLAAFNQRMRPEIAATLSDNKPRVRLEAVIALRELEASEAAPRLIELAAVEADRIVYYAAWGALMDLLSVDARRELLADQRNGVRLAAFLGLLEDDSLSDAEIQPFTDDPHAPIAQLATKRLGGKHTFEHRGRPLTAAGKKDGGDGKPVVLPFSDVAASTGRRYRAAVLTSGAKYYTDRPYSITRVPQELEGLTFLQTACHDADATSGISVTLNLKYPSTVYFIDDSRAEALPTWARGKWQPTSLRIEGSDPKVMKVYTADFPAGPLTLGTSRDGVNARKGNYIVAFQPILLTPNATAATAATTLPLLEKADPIRGRDLFYSKRGANCAACHQVAGRGNNHAPDLSHIGSRADANSLIESIINPSAQIVEGFAATSISSKQGDYAGVVLEETGRHVTLALMGGATVKIRRSGITHREGLPISAMPPSFGMMLNSQQLADLTAWLLTLKKPEPIKAKDGEFTFRRVDNELQLYLGQTRFATYLLDHDRLTRRGFIHVKTPSGHQVTRNFPDGDPGNSDHAVIHPGMWMSFGWLDGNDYWRLQSKVRFDRFLEEPKGGAGVGSFATRDQYLSKDGKQVVCTQDTTYRFRHVDSGILVDWDATFYNDERSFLFGDQEESGLAIRMATPIRVENGNGRIVNNRGEVNGKGTWGKPFDWINYSGEIAGKRVGFLIMPHPDNPRQCWSHSRDYGALVSNPFPKQPRERRQPFITTPVKQGKRFRLRYSVLIHEVKSEKFDAAGLARRLLQSIGEE
jgi:putative heme-binding domain-containing protein